MHFVRGSTAALGLKAKTHMNRRVLFGGIAGLGVGALASGVAISAAGAGHGTYLPAALLFPIPMLISVSLGTIGAVAAVIGLAQYPLYGVAAAAVTEKRRMSWVTLAGLHLVTALVSAWAVMQSKNFG